MAWSNIDWRAYAMAWGDVASTYFYQKEVGPMYEEVACHAVSQMFIGLFRYVAKEQGYKVENTTDALELIQNVQICWPQNTNCDIIMKYHEELTKWAQHCPDDVTINGTLIWGHALDLYSHLKDFLIDYEAYVTNKEPGSNVKNLLSTATGDKIRSE